MGDGQSTACWLAEGGRRLPVLEAAPVVPPPSPGPSTGAEVTAGDPD